MSDQDDKYVKKMNKGDLWAKAGSSEPITRHDLGIPLARDDSGMQVLNEGYLGKVHRFTLDDDKKE